MAERHDFVCDLDWCNKSVPIDQVPFTPMSKVYPSDWIVVQFNRHTETTVKAVKQIFCSFEHAAYVLTQEQRDLQDSKNKAQKERKDAAEKMVEDFGSDSVVLADPLPVLAESEHQT